MKCTLAVTGDLGRTVDRTKRDGKSAFTMTVFLSCIQNGIYIRLFGCGQMQTGHKDDFTFHGDFFHSYTVFVINGIIVCATLLFSFDEKDVALSERAVVVVDLGSQFVRRELFHTVFRLISLKDFLVADVALHQIVWPDVSIKFACR